MTVGKLVRKSGTVRLAYAPGTPERIGIYRAVFEVEGETFVILDYAQFRDPRPRYRAWGVTHLGTGYSAGPRKEDTIADAYHARVAMFTDMNPEFFHRCIDKVKAEQAAA